MQEDSPKGADMVDKKAADALKKLQRAEDGKKAMEEYEAQKLAVDANTARLRALRLEREAAAAAAPPEPKPAKKKAAVKTAAPKTAKTAKTAKKTKAASGNLATWLKDQKGSGRSS
jgi:hypothetical protein